jgi:hypothetical protein
MWRQLGLGFVKRSLGNLKFTLSSLSCSFCLKHDESSHLFPRRMVGPWKKSFHTSFAYSFEHEDNSSHPHIFSSLHVKAWIVLFVVALLLSCFLEICHHVFHCIHCYKLCISETPSNFWVVFFSKPSKFKFWCKMENFMFDGCF